MNEQLHPIFRDILNRQVDFAAREVVALATPPKPRVFAAIPRAAPETCSCPAYSFTHVYGYGDCFDMPSMRYGDRSSWD